MVKETGKEQQREVLLLSQKARVGRNLAGIYHKYHVSQRRNSVARQRTSQVARPNDQQHGLDSGLLAAHACAPSTVAFMAHIVLSSVSGPLARYALLTIPSSEARKVPGQR